VTQEHLEKGSGARNVGEASGTAGEDGDISTRQNWMEPSGLWPVLHWE